MKQVEEEIFADPTYDAGFKILFNRQENEKILKSFLNNLLDFKGMEQIKDIELVNPILYPATINSIDSAVDIRCIRESGEEISIEMQRRNEKYFLPRTQSYMAKMMHDQVKKGEGDKYHEVMKKTYILIIAIKNLFTGENILKGDSEKYYEKTVVPMCKELNVELAYNKMYWKFFELDKFKKCYKDTVIDTKYQEKDQWLNFLLNCSKQEDIPLNISDIIKEGYEAMKIQTLKEQKLDTMYWNAKAREDNYQLESEELEKKAFKEGEFKGFKEGEFKGKLKGEVKGEISKIKFGLKYKVEPEKIIEELNHTKPYFNAIQDHLNNGHFDDNESVILGGLKDTGAMDIEFS